MCNHQCTKTVNEKSHQAMLDKEEKDYSVVMFFGGCVIIFGIILLIGAILSK